MSQPSVTKVYLDSRYSLDGKTFDLSNAGLLLNPKSRCWLSEFTCVASWDTLDASNNQLVVIENNQLRVIWLTPGVHDIDSLRTALEEALNRDRPAGAGPYVVEKTSTGDSGSTYRSFVVFSAVGEFFFSQDPASTLSWLVFGNEEPANIQKSSFIDVRRVHNIYLHCPGFGAYQSYGCRGSRSILAKIPVLTGYGGLVHWQNSGSEHDCIDVGVSSLTSLKLELRDAEGIELDLQGTSWSCTLIFER